MIKRLFYLIFLLAFFNTLCGAQGFIKTSELFPGRIDRYGAGTISIVQDPAVDTLISRHITGNRKLKGMDGFRIQIYNSNNRNAREESNKINAEFLSRFPDITSRIEFEDPGYFKVRAGNYRTKFEGAKYLNMVRRVFPNAYLVPSLIDFPDEK
jgi:hypothetical protein